jgi:hypothetical protein
MAVFSEQSKAMQSTIFAACNTTWLLLAAVPLDFLLL